MPRTARRPCCSRAAGAPLDAQERAWLGSICASLRESLARILLQPPADEDDGDGSDEGVRRWHAEELASVEALDALSREPTRA